MPHAEKKSINEKDLCWADKPFRDDVLVVCNEQISTKIGLCEEHYKKIVLAEKIIFKKQ